MYGGEMKRIGLFMLVAVCLIALVGCVPGEPATIPLSATDVEQNARLSQLQQQVSNVQESKANTSAVSDLTQRVVTLEGYSSANTYTKAQLYTQAQVDDLIQALKDDQSWVKGRTSTSAAGTTVGEYGELISTNGDLELWLERVSGDASDELRTRNGANDARFDFVVVNLDGGSSHDFRIDFEFEPEDGENNLSINLTLSKAEASGNLEFEVPTRTPQPDADSVLRFDQDNTGRILKGDAEDFTVWLDIVQVAGGTTDWSYDIRIKDKD